MLMLAGHVWRKIGSIVRTTIRKNPVGKRPLERPRLRWEDCVKADAGKIQSEVLWWTTTIILHLTSASLSSCWSRRPGSRPAYSHRYGYLGRSLGSLSFAGLCHNHCLLTLRPVHPPLIDVTWLDDPLSRPPTTHRMSKSQDTTGNEQRPTVTRPIWLLDRRISRCFTNGTFVHVLKPMTHARLNSRRRRTSYTHDQLVPLREIVITKNYSVRQIINFKYFKHPLYSFIYFYWNTCYLLATHAHLHTVTRNYMHSTMKNSGGR